MNYRTYLEFHRHLQHWLGTNGGTNVFLILAVILTAVAIRKLLRR